jgi:hypothetical protein
MLIPPLFSVEAPMAPQWCEPRVSLEEAIYLRRTLALIVGYDTERGHIEPLGSGFIVSPMPNSLQIVTAPHILFWFVDRILGPAGRTALPDEKADLDVEAKRLQRVFKDGKIKAVIEVASTGETIIVDLTAGYFGNDVRANDIAVLRASRDLSRKEEFLSLMLDFAPATPMAEPYVMAGFVKMPKLPMEAESRVAEMRQNLVIRASPVVEITNNAPGRRRGALLMRLAAPSEHGMSGGPLFRFRLPRDKSIVIGHGTPHISAAVGVVSSGYPGGMFAGFQCPEGETWITPVELLRDIRIEPDFSFRDFIDCRVITYQDVEQGLVEIPNNLTPNEARLHNQEMLPILSQKMMRASRPVIDAYRAALSTLGSGLAAASRLPCSKSRIEKFLRIALAATKDETERASLKDTLLSLAQWQVGAGALSTSEMEKRVKRELHRLRA